VNPQSLRLSGVETLVCLYDTRESFDITHHTCVIVLCKYDRKKKMSDLTSAQIRAARALLDWTQPKLAQMSKLSVPTVRRMESARGPSASTAANVEAVRRALEGAGVVFLEAKENRDGGPGVRLGK
jgi:DNA-binding transcriptional regulator YiaG